MRPLTEDDYAAVLPLVAYYQRSYGVEEPDPARNDRFFRRFLEPSADGLLLGAFAGEELVGYACLYWTFSSVSARDVVLMNDLYVAPGQRGGGVGLALIEAARDVARDRGVAVLEWSTAPDNRRAQRLYEQMGAERSELFEYEVRLGPPPPP